MWLTRIPSCISDRWLRFAHKSTILVLAACLASISTAKMTSQPLRTPGATRGVFPTVDPAHLYARALLDNAMRYIAPKSGTRDASSGYPVEGWNNEPNSGLGLRSFTQLTAIGEWAELLANVAVGDAEVPYLSRKQALKDLQQVVASLLIDQKDPQISTMGLLGNFLDLEPGTRVGPLAGIVEKDRLLTAFGAEKGEAIWQALREKGWLNCQNGAHEAAIQRSAGYGAAFFEGPLAPYSDEGTRAAIMGLLDQRTVTIVFGDNANLSTSIATAIGALMSPRVRNLSEVRQVRAKMELFLERQQDGYTHLYDPKAGLFLFGWDAARNRFLGWQDDAGNLQCSYMDYMINEFRGPTAFVIMRYGLPTKAFANLAFKIKPYRLENRKDVYVLAPWDGSAFQALGLGLSVADGGYPSWQVLLQHVAEVEIDFARRHNLPGFLSESYTGEGARYTGDVGIPEIAVNTSPRITNVASLYTLGVAYGVAPAEIEQFLADNWATVSTLLTDHGPWEGFDVAKQKPVRIQTTAHTLSLILGILGTGQRNMMRYLDYKGLHSRLHEIYKPGERVNLLSKENQCFAWDVGGSELKSAREPAGFQVSGTGVKQLGVACVSARKQGMNLSNGLLTFRYRSDKPLERAKIQLKAVPDETARGPLLPVELLMSVGQTSGQDQEKEIQITLPATVGLSRIKEVVLVGEPADSGGVIDLAITQFDFRPYGS